MSQDQGENRKTPLRRGWRFAAPPAEPVVPPACRTAQEALAEIDRILREDWDLSREIEETNHAKSVHVGRCIREESAPFEAKMAPLRKRHARLRATALALWKIHFDNEIVMDLPVGKVSRRRYREMEVRNKTKLLEALDKADRLDLADYTFDEKGILKLLDNGKLSLPEGTIRIHSQFGLSLRRKEEI